MKRIIILLIGVVLGNGLLAQNLVSMNYMSDGTAYTVAKGRLEIGIFTGSRYGIKDDLELSTQSLISFLAPKLSVKKSWGEYGGFRFATEHGLFYPTVFMRIVTAKGTGGLISPEFTIPQMLSIDNSFIVSCKPLKRAVLSAHAGFNFGLKADHLDARTTIDMPVFYPRLVMFYNHPEIDLGVNFRGMFSSKYGYIFNVENFMVPNSRENYFMENDGILTYTSNKQTLHVEVGYKLSYGKYPYGVQWHLLPLIAVVF